MILPSRVLCWCWGRKWWISDCFYLLVSMFISNRNRWRDAVAKLVVFSFCYLLATLANHSSTMDREHVSLRLRKVMSLLDVSPFRSSRPASWRTPAGSLTSECCTERNRIISKKKKKKLDECYKRATVTKPGVLFSTQRTLTWFY